MCAPNQGELSQTKGLAPWFFFERCRTGTHLTPEVLAMSKQSSQDRRTSDAGRRTHSVEQVPQARPTPGRAQAYENAWRSNLLHWNDLPPDVQQSIKGH